MDTQNLHSSDDDHHQQSSPTFKEDPWKCLKCCAQFTQFKSWILHQQSHDHPHRKSTEQTQEEAEEIERVVKAEQPSQKYIIKIQNGDKLHYPIINPLIEHQDEEEPELDPITIVGLRAVSPVREKDENVPVIIMAESVPMKKAPVKKKRRPKHRYSLPKRKIRQVTATMQQKSKLFRKPTAQPHPNPKPRINNSNIPKPKINKNNINEKESSFKCALCPHRSPKISVLKTHLQKSHPPVRKFFGDIMQQQQSKKTNKTNLQNRNPTDKIEPAKTNKNSSAPISYERHVTRKILKGTSSVVYLCNYCKKQFPNSSRALKHTRVHTGEQPFSCPLCGRLFSQNQNMRRHLRIHKGTQNSYKCTFPGCAKLFRDGSLLKAHWQMHEKGSKNVKSNSGKRNSASSSSSSSTSVKKQMRQQQQKQQQGGKIQIKKNVKTTTIHKKKKSAKSISTKKSKLSSDHYKSSPHISCSVGKDGKIVYHCVFCPKEYSKPSEAVIHTRVHTGERPHKCRTCNKAFTKKNTLQQHIRTNH